jgi:hypothetical protein
MLTIRNPKLNLNCIKHVSTLAWIQFVEMNKKVRHIGKEFMTTTTKTRILYSSIHQVSNASLDDHSTNDE